MNKYIVSDKSSQPERHLPQLQATLARGGTVSRAALHVPSGDSLARPALPHCQPRGSWCTRDSAFQGKGEGRITRDIEISGSLHGGSGKRCGATGGISAQQGRVAKRTHVEDGRRKIRSGFLPDKGAA